MMIRATILALSLAFGSSAALASPASGEPRITVRTHDLNLNLASGRHQLETRIHDAARRLCRSDLRGVSERTIEAECIAATLATIRPKVEQAVVRAQGGRQLALLMLPLPR